jgi:hypothetical protein
VFDDCIQLTTAVLSGEHSVQMATGSNFENESTRERSTKLQDDPDSTACFVARSSMKSTRHSPPLGKPRFTIQQRSCMQPHRRTCTVPRTSVQLNVPWPYACVPWLEGSSCHVSTPTCRCSMARRLLMSVMCPHVPWLETCVSYFDRAHLTSSPLPSSP